MRTVINHGPVILASNHGGLITAVLQRPNRAIFFPLADFLEGLFLVAPAETECDSAIGGKTGALESALESSKRGGD